ncbi:MAG: TRAP transporter substrate-binding protein [Sneathiellales bacterium]|nr:TRAP transporter substrate-binding protein [Sneathiellales bacterium]
MTLKFMTRTAVAGLTCLGLVTAAAHAEEPVKLKMQSAYAAGLPALGETAKYFSDSVNKLSANSVRVKFYDPGKLVPTLQIFDAVQSGAVDAGYSWPGYWMGKMPALALFAAVPFGPEANDFLSWIYHGDGLKLWRELYEKQGVVPVPCGVLAPEAAGWFRKPIDNLDQLKGMKIRFGGLGGDVMKKLGASVTVLAAGDIMPNLERGVIDATEYSMPAIDEILGFYKVAKNYYFPGWHQPSSILELIVNKKKWDSLSDLQRASIETACQSATLWGMTKGIADQPKALDAIKSHGVKIHVWSDEALAAFRKASDEVLAENAAKDPDFKRVLENLNSFMSATSEWRGMAYAR